MTRLLEAARSMKIEAQTRRISNPPTRAESPYACVEVSASGAVVGLHCTDVRALGNDAGPHLLRLYQAAVTREAEAEDVRIVEVPPEELLGDDAGLGPGRFDPVPGVDPEAPPAQQVHQATQLLSQRFHAAEREAAVIAELEGSGSDEQGLVAVRIGAGNRLNDVRISSWTSSHSEEEIEEALSQAVAAAKRDLNEQIHEATRA